MAKTDKRKINDDILSAITSEGCVIKYKKKEPKKKQEIEEKIEEKIEEVTEERIEEVKEKPKRKRRTKKEIEEEKLEKKEEILEEKLEEEKTSILTAKIESEKVDTTEECSYTTQPLESDLECKVSNENDKKLGFWSKFKEKFSKKEKEENKDSKNSKKTKKKKKTSFKKKTNLKKKKEQSYTKKILGFILISSELQIWASYVLAAMGRDQIAESLSQQVVIVILGGIIPYFAKSLIENLSKNTTMFGENLKPVSSEVIDSVVEAVTSSSNSNINSDGNTNNININIEEVNEAENDENNEIYDESESAENIEG